MEIAVKIAQLMLSLGLLVICHEFGHFITAKIFKCRVEKFYLFFDPWFSIFKVKRGDTEYGIGWLPLGGYVKIAGMIDESMDTEQLKRPAEPWEFRSKPAWQRLIIMVAGVVVNIILAMFIYAMIAFAWGKTYLPVENLKYGIAVDSAGYAVGLRDGDMIKYVNGKPADNFSNVMLDILLDDPKTLTIGRNGKDTTITITDDKVALILKAQSAFIMPRFPFVVKEFAEGSPAKDAGFLPEDCIVSANGGQCKYFHEVRNFLDANKGKSVEFGVLRGADTLSIALTVPEDGMLKVYTKSIGDFLEYKTQQFGFFESFPEGISRGVDKIGEYCKQWKLIFNPETEAYKSVGSFISMTKIFPGTWDWYSFWNLTALFSIMLAVLNIIPIPGLDGGHALFTIVEMITGKKPSEKFLEYAQMVGMAILLIIMVFAIGNDFIRHVF